jgi:AcrR family transcriptional regulator
MYNCQVVALGFPPMAMARVRNQRGEGERLREALLDAARDLLAESHDADALSVRAVTARAGVSPTAMYLHFADKEELTSEVKERCFDELGAALREAQHANEGDQAAQMRAMGLAYLRFARERPGVYAILFQTRIPQKRAERLSPEDIGRGDEVFRILVSAVERCVDADAFEISCLVWMALHGRAAARAPVPDFPFPDDERFVDLLIGRTLGV